MSHLDWNIPVDQYTDAHWAVIEEQEREKEERKAFWMDQEE